MRRRARAVCNVPGCPELTDTGRCTACRRQADEHRGSTTARGYGVEHQRRFRAGVLAHDPICVGPDCTAAATVADHWPLSRRELVARGFDPDDPRYGRGLCVPCHSRATARLQPGGWNAR